MKILLLMLSLVFLVPAIPFSSAFNVNDPVLARWTNNRYYSGKVKSIVSQSIEILFDDGDETTHSLQDMSAVISDQPPNQVHIGNHVLATWDEVDKYFIGYVTDRDDINNRFEVTFDDNDKGSYTASDLRIFPDHRSPFEEGARVFALWPGNGLYYRGFVIRRRKSHAPRPGYINLMVRFDDGAELELHVTNKDPEKVILDKPPCYMDVHTGTAVIAFWPGTKYFYPGQVLFKRDYGHSQCYQRHVYEVLFDDGDERIEDFNQIRIVPNRIYTDM